ncbi:kinase-like protein [Lentinus tigrinus ALCF2SS1-7]|uniref:Kinase-like protein n=1 Tax=Lentinus tigrinus ALCF2SS1-6 TaxID=1328759 RepID=A0A5C2S1S4_9APHY|nr:kinase-like protein [Lentinus tigrinus ALCF2SS1-6]RPD72143.1 kinase-like protein [Lentinus tigrinus ALCF2SS1-7]
MFNTNQKQLPRHAILNQDALALSARSTDLGAYDLSPSEHFWQARHSHLKQHGYSLRPRYSPDWKPSWLGTNRDPLFCEDSIRSIARGVMDARRLSDNALVAIKRVPKDTEEMHIAQFLSSIRDPQNHCVPIIEILPDPFDSLLYLLVMPYLRQCNNPDFCSVGEVICFMEQTMEGLAFLHRNRVAHRDIAVQNIMMDARPLYPQGHHPVQLNYTPDGMYRISPLSRTDRPVRYYYIDFGLSVQFPKGASPYVVGDVGRDTDVPELSETVPYDAFKVDIFALGNLFYKEFYDKYNSMEWMADLIVPMRQTQPEARPTIDEVLERWKEIKTTLHPSLYRWRLGSKSEPAIERVFNNTVAAAWNGIYSLRKLVH